MNQGTKRVLLAGGSGLIGTALQQKLAQAGHEVVVLHRSREFAPSSVASWWPSEGRIQLDPDRVGRIDVVVNLAGAGIADKRWSAARKAEILSSRIESTRLLVRHFSAIADKPDLLIQASAIGYYGDRGDVLLHEDSSPGDDFLAEVCQAWEQEAVALEGIAGRVVRTRLGIVLSPAGGALARMRTPFALGLGGRVCSGRQYMSWIALEDVVGAMEHLMHAAKVRGPVNLVAPDAVRNSEFTRALARRLGRPAVMPLPAVAVRLALGEMGPALLCSSARVQPSVLQQSGYDFRYPDLKEYFASCAFSR